MRSGATPKVAQKLARHCDVRLTLGRYAHAGLHDLTAAVDALPDMLSPAGKREALAATGTDGKADTRQPAQLGKNSGPNLGPRLAKTADFGGQARTENGKTLDDANPVKIKVSTCFPMGELKEAPPGFEPGMADLQSYANFRIGFGYPSDVGFSQGLRM